MSCAKLHVHVVRIIVVNNQKVLGRSLRITAMDIEHVQVGIIIPDGGLVVQRDQVV